MSRTGESQHQRVLVFGAVSAIAREACRRYAEQGCSLYLVARNPEHLGVLAQDLRVRGAPLVQTGVLDFNHFELHEPEVDKAFTVLGEVDIALVCHGSLPDQGACERDFRLALAEINSNGLSVISLLTLLAPRMARQQHGTIAVITSVAGDRGRQSNFVYGAAKALVSTYLQGLRGRLLASNVHVVDIRPGFVDSPMTAAFRKGLLWSSPARVADIMIRSIARRRHTVYAPFWWRYIMFVVRMVPEFIFKRLKF